MHLKGEILKNLLSFFNDDYILKRGGGGAQVIKQIPNYKYSEWMVDLGLDDIELIDIDALDGEESTWLLDQVWFAILKRLWA